MEHAQNVYRVVQHIPMGKVATYGQIAKLAGIKNPRLVGSLLHRNPDQKNIPCHRVVNAEGKLAITFAFGGAKEQRDRLQKEGVEVKNGCVDLTRFCWTLDKLSDV